MRRLMVIVVAYPFLVLAAVGFGLSAVVHVGSLLGLLGLAGPLDVWVVLGLHVGLFLVWPAAWRASDRLSRHVPRKDVGQVTFRGCPAWMQYAVWELLGYTLLHFLLLGLLLAVAGETYWSNTLDMLPPDTLPPILVPVCSAFWMTGYALAVAPLYSYTQVGGEVHRCASGHDVSPLAQFCEQCGQPVRDQAHIGPTASNATP